MFEDFGNYQFKYVRDKGWPANYILVQKNEEDGKKKGKLLFRLVINFYKEGNYVYFSYIEGKNIASQFCYSKKEILYRKINIKNNSLEIIDRNYFSRSHTLPDKTKMWSEDSKNRCN